MAHKTTKPDPYKAAAAEELYQALKLVQRLITEALPKFNWGASALDANAIQLLNEVPLQVNAAIAKAEGRGVKP